MVKSFFKNPRVFYSAVIGNVFELYDLGLYAVYACHFAKLFFVTPDPFYSMIYSWLALGIGLFSRPLGSIFLDI